MGRSERALLRQLRDEFQLEPIPDLGRRVHEVNQRYSGLLQIPDFEEWTRSHGV